MMPFFSENSPSLEFSRPLHGFAVLPQALLRMQESHRAPLPSEHLWNVNPDSAGDPGGKSMEKLLISEFPQLFQE